MVRPRRESMPTSAKFVFSVNSDFAIPLSSAMITNALAAVVNCVGAALVVAGGAEAFSGICFFAVR